MVRHEGGDDDAAERWDARAEVDVAVLIRRYLSDHPPPASSELAADLRLWSQNLTHDGLARLEACGGRRLRAV
jgi:hypothetical protein